MEKEKEREDLGTYPFDEVESKYDMEIGHTCTSRCGEDIDCPLCEHGKIKCKICD